MLSFVYHNFCDLVCTWLALSHDVVTYDVNDNVWAAYWHTASFHQAIRSTGYALPFKAGCLVVIGWFSTAVIGAF